MVYRDKPVTIGITITIKPYRKCGNGAVGGGRKNSTGKRAVVINQAGEETVITDSTTKNLLKKIRQQFKISPSIRINETGETVI